MNQFPHDPPRLVPSYGGVRSANSKGLGSEMHRKMSRGASFIRWLRSFKIRFCPRCRLQSAEALTINCGCEFYASLQQSPQVTDEVRHD